jgi:hypothetical protein
VALGGPLRGCGRLGLGTELYLLREVLVALGGDETAVGLGLGAWLLGIALGAGRGAGAAVAARGHARGGRARAARPRGLAGDRCRAARARVLGVPRGSYRRSARRCCSPGDLRAAGGAGRRHLRRARGGVDAAGDRDGQRAIGALYVAESLGSLARGCWCRGPRPLRPPLAGMALLAALALALALPAARGGLIAGRWALRCCPRRARRGRRPATARLEEWLQRARFGVLVRELPLLEWADTPYQSLAVGGGEVRALFASGGVRRKLPDPEATRRARHRAMALAERPRRCSRSAAS